MRAISLIFMVCGLALASDASAQAFRGACHVDTICPGVSRGGGRILNCLRAHKGELPEECFTAIGHSVMNWRGKGHGGGHASGAAT